MNKISFRILRREAVKEGYKYGLIMCPYLTKEGTPCEAHFVYRSDNWFAHLLFYHGQYVESPPELKVKLEDKVTRAGYKLRPPIRKERTANRWIKYTTETQMWNYRIKVMIMWLNDSTRS